jgi:hypothetical protein
MQRIVIGLLLSVLFWRPSSFGQTQQERPLGQQSLPKQQTRRFYDVPHDQWQVMLVPSPLNGDPLLLVTVDPNFKWPAPLGKPPRTVVYHVRLRRPGEKPVDVGQITAEERFSIVMVSERLAAELVEAPRQQENAPSEVNKADLLWEQIKAADIEALPELYRRFSEVFPVEEDLFDEQERRKIFKDEIELVPYDGPHPLPRQDAEPKKADDKAKYDWEKEITTEGDPCKGKKPRDCAREKLIKIKDRICEAKTADKKARFPKECEQLKAMLEKKPAEPEIACVLPKESEPGSGHHKEGLTEGETDPLTGVITLNGEHLLSDNCGETTVMHELKHKEDFSDPKKMTNLKKLHELQAALNEAKNKLEAAKKSKNAAAEAQAKTEGDDILKKIKNTEKPAAEELITTECNALFQVLDNADFFNYPGEGNALIKKNIKGMVGELGSIRKEFDLQKGTPETRGALCSCFTKIETWVGGQPVVKKNFDAEIYPGKTPKPLTWTESISLLKKNYCR